ncbi:hypothetical protein PLESTB_000519200 [Pleodorina starrii]|uniref:Uncharacterized protein n=1 Tax=Pleodorina starrii TaxID=330485 RepID=A0A9W6BHA1_9CHLO|nr:hypothetical protein PLESTB_000519200 [Pleodorina starrii]GLC72361.1 hypothetical protein PLESTF_001239500 [Pleodorina starrii]
MPLGACATEALVGCDSAPFAPSWMAAPAMNLFGGFQDHLGTANEDLLGPTPEGQVSLFAGAEYALHGLSQEQKEIFRQYSQHVEQEREAQARIQHAFEAVAASSSGGTPTHSNLLGQSQSLSPPPPPAQQPPSSQNSSFTHSSVSVPATPLPFDNGLTGLGGSALSTPTISTGSLSLAGAVMGTSAVDAATSALHNSSPMTPRQMLAPPEHMLMVPSASLLSVHAPSPGQNPSGQVPPPPTPATPSNMLAVGNGGPSGSTGAGGSGASASGPGQGHLTMAFANALAQAAAERGVDPASLFQILQSPKIVDVLLSKAGDLQLQQQQQQQHAQMGQMPLQAPPPPPPPPPKPPQLQSRMSAPAPGEWPHHPAAAGLAGPPAGLPHFRPPPPPPPRPSPATTAAAAAAAAAAASFGVPAGSSSGAPSSGGASAASSVGGGSSSSGGGSGSLDNVPSMQQMLSSHLVQEFVSARGVLVQLMLSAFAFLNSDSMREFYDKLMPVSVLYDEMHELPVVQKRKRCLDMSYLRLQLMQDPAFTQILQAVCALRHHLHSLSRKVLVMNQGPDGIPIDLLLGSMSTELFHVMKTVLPQEVCDFFGNCLPHPRLAVLVFAEFTSVDPMPTLT